MTAKFKTFAENTVGYASEINEYLMRQSTIVCSNQADRDSISSPQAGLTVYRLDTKAIERYDGTEWIAFDSEWQDYTPTIYTNGVNMTLGNGTSVGKYFRTGKKVSVKCRLVLGSTTTWSGASGGQELTLPLPSNYTAAIDNICPLGNFSVYNSGVASSNGNVELSSTNTRAILLYYKYGSTANDRLEVTNIAPFTTAVGDSMAGSFEYEIA